MAVASFEDLCAGFCEIAGVPAPELEADELGLMAFNVHVHDVAIDVLHNAKESGDRAFILFDLGNIEQDESRPATGMQALLDRNFLPMQPHAGFFGRNPATGHAVLQYVYPFFEVTPTGLLELINTGLEAVSHWRQTARLTGGSTDPEVSRCSSTLLADFA